MKKYLTKWDEEVLVPYIVETLKERKGAPVTNRTLRVLADMTFNVRILASTIRCAIHVIRTKSLLDNVVASKRGYWVSTDLNEMNTYIESLQDRAVQIHEVQSALKKQVQRTLVGQLAIEEVSCV